MEPKPMSKPKAILMFGAPGAGKGTIGSALCSFGGHYHLSSGDIFRGLPKESESGKLFFQYASNGKLVPDDVTIDIWWRYTKGLMDTNRFDPAKQYLFLDGLPRTKEQAKLIEEYVDVVQVIVLDITDEEVLFQRLGNRAKIEGRADDANREIIVNRLKEYHAKTSPVLEHYSEDIISTINAEQTPFEVLRDVLTATSGVLKQSVK